MTPKPFAHALAAAVYIVGIVLVINLIFSLGGEGGDGKDEPLILPMVMLSLLTLSVAVMGYLFAFQPIRLFIEGQKTEAVSFFLKTVAIFACFVALFVITWLSTGF